jgi:hypothetical protein
MNLIDRIKRKTPARDKLHGKISTVVGVVCVTLLSLETFEDKTVVALLTVGAVLFGGKSIYHAQKIKK